MTNLTINTLTGTAGVLTSVTENTPLPMIVYGLILLVAEFYKYKRSKNELKK